MSVRYSKEMRKLAKEQETSLLTIDVPGLEYQTPSATKDQVADLIDLFLKWQKEEVARHGQ